MNCRPFDLEILLPHLVPLPQTTPSLSPPQLQKVVRPGRDRANSQAAIQSIQQGRWIDLSTFYAGPLSAMELYPEVQSSNQSLVDIDRPMDPIQTIDFSDSSSMVLNQPFMYSLLPTVDLNGLGTVSAFCVPSSSTSIHSPSSSSSDGFISSASSPFHLLPPLQRAYLMSQLMQFVPHAPLLPGASPHPHVAPLPSHPLSPFPPSLLPPSAIRSVVVHKENNTPFVPQFRHNLMSPTATTIPMIQPVHESSKPTGRIVGHSKSHESGDQSSHSSTPSPPTNTSDDDEPQMSTPDDPVIHSPPSLGGQLVNGYNSGSMPKMEDGLGMNCTSPEGSMDPNGDGDARRRQKTCRVCGDHATGYNFNVITCESCKAFFRRNALRPKEFKCPYSEDCEINAVSRRFCQKCRLRKCFSVGMKKEWILNEEQLRRRKNSRLNNMATQQRQKQVHSELAVRQQQAMKAMGSPLSISPMEAQFQLGALNGRAGQQPLVSPTGQGFQYPLMSPAGSATSSDSPPSRPLGLMGTPGGQRSPDAYESNIMMQQRLRSAAQMSLPSPVAVGPDGQRKQVVLSMDEYHNLVQMAGNKNQEDEPPTKRSVYSPSDLAAPQPRPFGSPIGSPLGGGAQQQCATTTASIRSPGMNTYMDLGAAAAAPQDLKPPPSQYPSAMMQDKMKEMSMYFDKTIEDALKIDSPEAAYRMHGICSNESEMLPMGADPRLNYQLNSAELRALDLVSEAFKGMNDPMEQGRQKASFLKTEKSPADIMNIMDVAMRRLVKMAKKLPAFNDLSQDGKFALLKAGMVEMLTIRGVTRFDSNTGVWRSPTVQEGGEVPFDMFDQLNKDVRGEQKSRVEQFFKVFHEDIRTNDLAISLIMLIVLFSPRDVITDENDKKQIAGYYQQYCSLLNRYLESLFGDDAHKLCDQLPEALLMLKGISKNAGMLFLGTVNTSEAEALPREIFKVE